MESSLRFLIACMLLSSSITHTLDINSSNLIVSRMTISDIFGLLAIALFSINTVINKSWKNTIPRMYKLGAVVVVCLALSFFTSLSPKSTIFEVLILSYLVLLSYVVYEVYKSKITTFIALLTTVSFFTFAIGFYDIFAANLNWKTIFPSVNLNQVGSSFRYFGQAANYSFTMLTLLIPLKYTALTDAYSLKQKIFLNATIVLGILFLFSTGRISILLSFFMSVVLFVLYVRKKQIIKETSYIIISLATFILIGIYTLPNLVSNVIDRFEQRISHRETGNLATDFIVDNFKNSFVSFFDNPIFGSGLGGFVNHYSQYEIHGTYFKMLGETGLIGLLGYLLFIITFVKICLKSKSKFFYYFLPFLMGSLVSWGYNYHLRKKEFWILLAFLMMLEFINKKKAELEKH